MQNSNSLNGCILKGMFGGQLLTVVGINANDCIYPFAYVAMDKKNKEIWMWFLNQLADDLDIANSYHYTFMSDKQKVFVAC